ncbi:MAG: Ni/Fe-hydrogenase cytochrome b subunit [Saezia sp.]
MSSHDHLEPQPLGKPWINRPVAFFVIFAIIAFILIGKRLFFGLGSVTNLNGGYPWGVWIAFDLITGTGFACGGWALGWLTYVFNRGEYHPMVRSALVASFLGYSLGGLSIMIDIGRYWNVYYFYVPWQINTSSVLFETAFCMTLYIFVMVFELLPIILERFKLYKPLKHLNKVMFLILGFGVLLPTMHQSSMGSLMIAAGHKLHPLWQSQEFLGLFALLTAFIMGMSIAIFEGSLVMKALKGKSPDETALFKKLANTIVVLVGLFVFIRFAEIIYRGKLGYLANFDFYSFMFFAEILFFAIGLFIFTNKACRMNAKSLFMGAFFILLGAATWRMTYTLIAYNPGEGYLYYPSAEELLITFGFVSIEVVGFIVIVKLFPVLFLPTKKKDSSPQVVQQPVNA